MRFTYEMKGKWLSLFLEADEVLLGFRANQFPKKPRWFFDVQWKIGKIF
jgi:hypothetical protein